MIGGVQGNNHRAVIMVRRLAKDSLCLPNAPQKRMSANQIGNSLKHAETVASNLQIPPRQVSAKERTSQEVLASEEKEQDPAYLSVPCSVPRKRRSANTLREQSLPRKHIRRTGTDFGDNNMSIQPGGDNGQIEPLDDIHAQFAQLRLDREERAKTKEYVEKESSLGERVIRSGNLRKCMLCGDKIQWIGKCQECVNSSCRVWLETTMPEDEYLMILDGLVEQNQDRLTKAEEEEEKVVGQSHLNAIE